MGTKKLARRKGLDKTSGSNYTIEEILAKAADLMEEYNYDLAQKFCQRALEIDGDHPQALEMTGNLLLEVGEMEKAQHCLGRAIFVQPDRGHTKYMTAAQLFSGTEARDLYLKGIALLQSTAAASNSEKEQAEARAELSTAWVAVSELYMTDLCDEADAGTEAKKCVDTAVEVDSTNPEGWQALASYLLVIGDTEEAARAMDRSLQLWLPQHLAWAATGEGEQTDLSYNTRLAAVKLLLDLEQFDRAAEILDSLLEEDDEVVAPWYMHGWLNYLRNDSDYHGNVRHYLCRAKQVHVMNPTDDEAMMQHIEELLAEVGQEDPAPPVDDVLEYKEEDGKRAEKIAQILDQEKDEEPDEAMILN